MAPMPAPIPALSSALIPAPNEPIGVLIVGAGLSGLAMALECGAAGLDWRIVEANGAPGGTWALNTYPGAACDVPSHLYHLARRPHAGWSRAYAPAPEIAAYAARVAAEPALAGRIRYRTRMTRAEWDDGWRVALDGPEGVRTVRARRLVLATGMLHVPRRPDLPGLDAFDGPVMHTAEWDARFDASGKRIAVIGTGASAVQVVPELAREAASLALYQRSAPWVVGKSDPTFERRAALFAALPPARALYRQWLHRFHEMRHMVWRGHERAVEWAERMARETMEAAVADPALRAALTPGYRIGCKRILQSSDYYPALARPNVEVVTGRIGRIEPDRIVAGGTERPADAIVLATGFRVAEAAGLDVRGLGGRTLREAWAERPAAHVGTYVRGFPDMAVLLGPGTALGHNSVVLMAEAQARHAARLWSRADRPIQPREGAQVAWLDEMDAMAARTVWGLGPGSGGCASWYHDRAGRPSIAWPGTVGQFRRRLRRTGIADYEPV